jgi:hypothetical protein
VARIFGFNFSGFFAWWMWRTVYLSKLPGLDKKVRVAFDWTLDLLFPKDVCAVYDLDHTREFDRRDHTRNALGNNGDLPSNGAPAGALKNGKWPVRIEPLGTERYGWANPKVE